MIIRYLNCFTLSLLLTLLYTDLQAQNTSISDFTGYWFVEELDNSVIEIVEVKSGGYEGFIRSSDKAEFVGKKMVYDCKYDSEEKHFVGTIYSVARNIELNGTFILLSKKEMKVTVQKFILTKTIFWKRRD